MGKEINIVTLVDAERIMEQMNSKGYPKGSFNEPNVLIALNDPDSLIYMVAHRGFVYQGKEGSSKLEIQAQTGDTIVWSMTTFGNGADYSVYLYGHYFYVTAGAWPAGLANPRYFRQTVGLYLPNEEIIDPYISECPLAPVENQHYKFAVDVVGVDQEIQYTMYFRIVDNATGETTGYFIWQPILKIPF